MPPAAMSRPPAARGQRPDGLPAGPPTFGGKQSRAADRRARGSGIGGLADSATISTRRQGPSPAKSSAWRTRHGARGTRHRPRVALGVRGRSAGDDALRRARELLRGGCSTALSARWRGSARVDGPRVPREGTVLGPPVRSRSCADRSTDSRGREGALGDDPARLAQPPWRSSRSSMPRCRRSSAATSSWSTSRGSPCGSGAAEGPMEPTRPPCSPSNRRGPHAAPSDGTSSRHQAVDVRWAVTHPRSRVAGEDRRLRHRLPPRLNPNHGPAESWSDRRLHRPRQARGPSPRRQKTSPRCSMSSRR